MAYWVFQGNAELNMENDPLIWKFEPNHYAYELEIGDTAFIWRVEGNAKDGIIALCEITESPYEVRQDFRIPLKILETRKSVQENMLLHQELKQLYELQNLDIFKISEMSIYRLTEEEFECIHTLWQTPDSMVKKLKNIHLDPFLYLYKQHHTEWLLNQEMEEESYRFFQEFSRKEFLETIQWLDIQKIGEYLSAFRFPIARARTFGQLAAPISHYRASFLHLIFGDPPFYKRLEEFMYNEKYKLYGFGSHAIVELVTKLFPNYLCYLNSKEVHTLQKILKLSPPDGKEKNLAQKLVNQKDYLFEIGLVDKYIEIVGKQTNLPIFYEISEFLGFLSETYGEEHEQDFIALELAEEQHQYWFIGEKKRKSKLEELIYHKCIEMESKRLGNLEAYKSKEEVAKALKRTKKSFYHAIEYFQFCHEMQVGDFIFLQEEEIIAIGEIISNYTYDESRDKAESFRKVKWIATGHWNVSGTIHYSKFLTNITSNKDFVTYLLDLFSEDQTHVIVEDSEKELEGLEKSEFQTMESEEVLYEEELTVNMEEWFPAELEIIQEVPSYTEEDFLDEVFINKEKADEIFSCLDRKKNIMLEGASGVGKTFIAKKIAYSHMNKQDESKIAMIHFHPAFTYENFIGGYRQLSDGKVLYTAGIFSRFCEKASADPSNNYYFILDDLHNIKMSTIFGEAIMMLEADKRGREYALNIGHGETELLFYIPENIFIIGTSLCSSPPSSPIDFSMRRRFATIMLEPAFQSETFRQYLIGKGISEEFTAQLSVHLTDINEEILADTQHFGRGYEIGHSYFCSNVSFVENESSWFEQIIRLEIAPIYNSKKMNRRLDTDRLIKTMQEVAMKKDTVK